MVLSSNFASGVLVTLTGGIILEVIRRYLRRKRQRRDWYRTACRLTGQIKQLGRQATEFQREVDAETLTGDLNKRSGELQGHVDGAPPIHR